MTAELRFDASEIADLSRALSKVPADIKAKAFSRAMRRIGEMTRTGVIAESVKRTKSPPSIVRRATSRAFFSQSDSSLELKMKSGWIGIIKLGARQTREGVNTKLRGSYRSAFIATMSSGHRAVMMRSGKARTPIHELFGPNPAHDVVNNPDEFVNVLANIIEQRLTPRVLHEIENLLRR